MRAPDGAVLWGRARPPGAAVAAVAEQVRLNPRPGRCRAAGIPYSCGFWMCCHIPSHLWSTWIRTMAENTSIMARRPAPVPIGTCAPRRCAVHLSSAFHPAPGRPHPLRLITWKAAQKGKNPHPGAPAPSGLLHQPAAVGRLQRFSPRRGSRSLVRLPPRVPSSKLRIIRAASQRGTRAASATNIVARLLCNSQYIRQTRAAAPRLYQAGRSRTADRRGPRRQLAPTSRRRGWFHHPPHVESV